jgi:hypothetical protein
VSEAALIENAPHALGECNQIAAVEAHAADLDAAN